MNKFFIYTRGRAGSSAIIDELNSHSECACHTEVFRRNPLRNKTVREAYESMGQAYLKLRLNNDKALPYGLWQQLDGTQEKTFENYLSFLEADAQNNNNEAIGFKLLYNQDSERQGLLENLQENKFKAIHLIRRNVVRQVISGIIAKQRGIYNRRNFTPPQASHNINTKDFKNNVKQNLRQLAETSCRLTSLGFDTCDIYYEDFLDNRDAFYRSLLSNLNITTETLTPSTFTVMVPKDLREIITNYDKIEKEAKSIGLEHLLTST